MCWFLILSSIIMNSVLHACPTCVGKVDKNSPPFFSADYASQYHTNRKKVSLKKQETKSVSATTTPEKGAQS